MEAATEQARGYVRHEGCDHIFFVGFLGAGKSTLARSLGTLFGRSYLDTDRMVERTLGKPIGRIFAEDGEGAFRVAETHALESLEGRKSLLVSCGGGVVERPCNVVLMHGMGVVVYLDGDLDDSLRQIRCVERRPDLGDEEHARAVFAHRQPLFAEAADYVVDIRGRGFDEVASDAAQLLWEEGLL